MGALGQLQTDKPIEQAMREIKDWLTRMKISGLSMDIRYDAPTKVAMLKFEYGGKHYEFRSQQQNNCRLNMWAIARVMEYKVRSHLMGIEQFDKSMQAYLMIENQSSYQNPEQRSDISDKYYVILGISPLASNEEITSHYKKMAKSFHPDMALSQEAKTEFEKRMSEINQAYTEIKKSRGI